MSTAATETKTSLADVAKVSELKDLGWDVIEADDKKSWSAHEHAGELRSVGPASSVSALYTQVKLAVGEPSNGNGKGKKVKVGSSKLEGGKYTDVEPKEVTEIVPDQTEIELSEDSQGNTYLPGTAPRVNKQLATAALTHYRVKTERMLLTKSEKDAKDSLITVSKVHRDLFKKNGEGKLVYMAGDVEIEYIHEEKDNVKTKLVGNADDDEEADV